VTKNEEMFALCRALKGHYVLGMITDNPLERMRLMDEDMQLENLFDPIIVSADVRALKHDGTPVIFDAALQQCNCQPEEAVFIDNQQRNLSVPAAMGMQTYWYDDSLHDIAALRSALAEWGVQIQAQK